MDTPRLLSKLARETGLGPSPTFTGLHVFKAIRLIGEAGSMGRATLARKLHVGDGAVRTLIERLRQENLLTVDAEGCRLTSRGKKLFDKWHEDIPVITPLEPDSLAIGPYSFAAVVKDRVRALRNGIEQRDAAVRAGGLGAVSLGYRTNRFFIPGGSQDCEKDFPGNVWIKLRAVLNPEDGDAIAIGSAEDPEYAELCTMAAALTLLENPNGF